VKLALSQIVPHPDNPNVMSRCALDKLRKHIGQTGRYAPLIVRTLGRSKRFARYKGKYQLIDGHQRLRALAELGYKTVHVADWGDLTDRQTDILLLTLNRLTGGDDPAKRARLIKRVLDRQESSLKELARLLPDSQRALQRLIELTRPQANTLPPPPDPADQPVPFAVYLTPRQHRLLQQALKKTKTPAARTHAAALEKILQQFLDQNPPR